MRHEAIGERPDAGPLSAAIGRHAASRDRDGAFPAEAFRVLEQRGHVARPPVGAGESGPLLRLLAEVGRGDLSVGRVFEGHCNALFLIRSFGTPEQRGRFGAVAQGGGLFGVWNTDAPQDPLRLAHGALAGAKNFASGVDGLARAIVTVEEPAGRVMIVAPPGGLPVDRSWWRPMGMRASGSHVVDFTGLRVEPDWILGRPGDYVRQPWFSGGAIRFAAVHVGGMHAVFDAAVAHLARAGRIADPHQAHRVARMGIAVEGGYNWLCRAGAAWDAAERDPEGTGAALVAVANATRTAVEAAALAVLEEAERAVGAAGMIAPHPLERLVRDLRTYLRQPNPDGALAGLAAAVASGAWAPGRSGEGEAP